MTFGQLQIFLKVNETGSFTKAGLALNMTQPAVSHAVSVMEAELGVKLLVRDRRSGLKLTEAGEQMLIHVREIMNHAGKIEEIAAAVQGLEVGTIRIASFPSAATQLLPTLMMEFRTAHPNIRIELIEGSYEAVEALLLNHTADLGFVVLPTSKLETIPMLRDQMVAVLPKHHRLAKKKSISIHDLSKEILITSNEGYEDPVVSLFLQEGLYPHSGYSIQNTGTMIRMVEAGLGLTILPELALRDSQANVHISELNPPVWRELGLACPSFSSASPAVHAFIKMCQKIIPTLHMGELIPN